MDQTLQFKNYIPGWTNKHDNGPLIKTSLNHKESVCHKGWICQPLKTLWFLRPANAGQSGSAQIINGWGVRSSCLVVQSIFQWLLTLFRIKQSIFTVILRVLYSLTSLPRIFLFWSLILPSSPHFSPTWPLLFLDSINFEQNSVPSNSYVEATRAAIYRCFCREGLYRCNCIKMGP